VAFAVAGCTSSPVGSRVTQAPTSAPTASAPTAHPVSTPPPTPTTSGAKPVKVACADLVPPAVAAGLAPGYAPVPGYVPAADSPVAHLAALGGTACAWKDAKTGHVLEVAVAHPSAADALALKNDLVERSNSVPTYHEEAYFTTSNGVGEVDDFHGPFWIVASSRDLFEPGDASGIIAAADAQLDTLG
jgi:hypothetical protein